MKNCILIGVGGQGTILASKLISQAAIDKGLQVLTTETIGMAQRGGSVTSHVRMGEAVYSPLIPLGEADLVIGFEPAEAIRALPYLNKGGTMIVSNRAIMPVTSALTNTSYEGEEMISHLRKYVSNLIVIDTDKICETCNSSKVVNISLLGAAGASNVLEISLEDFENTIKKVLPERYVEMNLKALQLGAETLENK